MPPGTGMRLYLIDIEAIAAGPPLLGGASADVGEIRSCSRHFGSSFTASLARNRLCGRLSVSSLQHRKCLRKEARTAKIARLQCQRDSWAIAREQNRHSGIDFGPDCNFAQIKSRSDRTGRFSASDRKSRYPTPD